MPSFPGGLPALECSLKISRRIGQNQNHELSQSVRSYGWNYLSAVFSVEPEVAVQRQDHAFRVQFRHPHQTAVRQGHGRVAVLVKQVGNAFCFFV